MDVATAAVLGGLGLALLVSAPWLLLYLQQGKTADVRQKADGLERERDALQDVARRRAERIERLELLRDDLEKSLDGIASDLPRCAEPGSARDSLLGLLQEAGDRARADRDDALPDDAARDAGDPGAVDHS